jgi:hypothetical protein
MFQNFPKDTNYQNILLPVMLLEINKGIPSFKGIEYNNTL